MSTIDEIRATFFNYDKPTEELISDLIFATNGFRLPTTGVTYGAPVVVTTGDSAPSQLNTAVTVTIPWAPGIQNWGEQTFFYMRPTLANQIGVTGAQPIVITSYPTDTWTLLPLINAYYGLQLTTADVLNTVYPDSTGPFIMTAAPGSLIFTGSIELPIAGYTPPSSDGTTPPGDGTTPPLNSDGTDGTEPDLGPDWEPNGESGADAG